MNVRWKKNLPRLKPKLREYQLWGFNLQCVMEHSLSLQSRDANEKSQKDNANDELATKTAAEAATKMAAAKRQGNRVRIEQAEIADKGAQQKERGDKAAAAQAAAVGAATSPLQFLHAPSPSHQQRLVAEPQAFGSCFRALGRELVTGSVSFCELVCRSWTKMSLRPC